MSPEESVSRSALDKPLHQLTEDDISQLTREDCRRYLKEKGMRRPSWNKSQAIQQVISLKTLLETPPDSDAGARRKLYIPRPENPQRVPKGPRADAPISVSADDSLSYRRKGADKAPDPTGSQSSRRFAAEDDSVPPRTTGATTGPVGQMTIFYCGKVNVYDDVPTDKAKTLMQLAANPHHLPLEAPFDGTTVRQSLPFHIEAGNVKVGPDSRTILPNLQTVNMTDSIRLCREEINIFREDNPAADGTATRKASVQRYREKRKERFKSKRKMGMPSSSSLDIYLNQQIGNHTLNEHSSRSDAGSPPDIRPPNTPTRCSSVDNK